ncbi:hypothetical protein ACFO1B_54015 [Dactylosporangium siamense]|uniref:Uncharacterized protein n=1 Tax=Dactylosporangium siamense TaxID=685454 RepID=A0A919PZW9_9ACTN|nr:hypothetical protein [Dactylosporangium siamense]GIG52326.1 hypothetical protein Dsi01nite_103670 [Dactylosporangium siamense]
MEAPARRRARLLAAFVVLTTVCSLSFTLSPAAHAETTEPTESTEPSPPPSSEPPAPTTEPPTTQPPAATTEPPTQAPKVRKLTLGASNVELGGAYWQGDGKAKLVISVQNSGDVREKVAGSYTFPGGDQNVTVADSYGTDGCNPDGALGFTCMLPPGGLGYLVVTVVVGPDAWKVTGTGTVKVSTHPDNAVTRSRSFALTFTPPPVPGIELTTDRPSLPAQPTPAVEQTTLAVKLRNTGSAKAGGAIEVVTPPGVDVVSFPAVCKVKKKISAERDRCELGDVAAGKDVVASFGLSVSAAAHAELPLTGAVHGYLTPAGLAAIETRTDYTIIGPPPVGESAMPTAAPPSPVAVVARTADPERPASGGLLTSERLSSLPFVGGIIGLVALVGFLVVLSLRRRLRDEAEAAEVEAEEPVTVPAPRRSDEDLPPLPQRSPIPRSLTLPRLPSGPVAGSGFREPEE